MIDLELRSRGVAGSDIGPILGLDGRRDAFTVWADKLGLVERGAPNARMRVGKRFEKVIIEWYAEETGRTRPGEVAWSDKTLVHPERTWQLGSPDAFVWADGHRVGGIDAKSVALDQVSKWGERDSDVVPDSIALQMAWYCSLTELPWFDVAALVGGNDLRIRRVHRDPQIEAVMLDEGERFWFKHVMARNAPAPGFRSSDALKKMFPRNVEALRDATDHEATLLEALRHARDRFDEVDREHGAAENAVKLAIGDGDGLVYAGGKVTWRKDRDTVGTDWAAVAREIGLRHDAVRLVAESAYRCPEWLLSFRTDVTDAAIEKVGGVAELITTNQVVTREGPRKLRCTFKGE